MQTIKVFILAAGESSRLGYPKQLVLFKGKNLINHTIDTVIDAGLYDLNVVLGANSDEINKSINNQEVEIINNDSWKEGMSSSIRIAMDTIRSRDTDAVLLLTCDQPFLSCEILKKLIVQHREDKEKIICCAYTTGFGPPSLFPKAYFPELKKLIGDKGGKSIIKMNMDKVIWVDFPDGIKDIDTKEDVQDLEN